MIPNFIPTLLLLSTLPLLQACNEVTNPLILPLDSTASLLIGAKHTNDGTGYTDSYHGSLDEVGIWSRGLHPKEMQQLYRRGINRIKYQVRNCAAGDCKSDPAGLNWKGPSGTNQTYFSELNNNTAQMNTLGLVKKNQPVMTFANFTNPPTASAYFQYRTILESSDEASVCNYGAGPAPCSAELRTVSIGPNHYASSAPPIVTKTSVNYITLNTFKETLGSSCTAGTAYNLGVGADFSTCLWYYWASNKASDCTSAGAGAWCLSDSTAAQSSSTSIMSANLTSFPAKAGIGKLFVKAYLRTDGTSGCELQKIDLSG